jgi:hypothetical protein
MQARAERLAGDARLSVFASRPWFYVAGLAAAGSLAFIAIILAIAFVQTGSPDAQALKVDFRVFWAAGKLAVAGEPLAVHDISRLSAAHATYVEEYMPWLYPPGFIVLVTPLGTMSFAMAYLVWTLLSLILVGWALRSFTARVGPLWLLVALAPAFYPTLLMGQTSLFWMAGLLAALAALRDGRMVLAGIFLGCLTLKPQLGLLIPLALLAAGAWRTILAAIATTAILAILPTFYYGLSYWTLFRAGLARQGEWLASSVNDILLMVGPAFTLSFLGVGGTVAWTVHWIIAVGSAIAVLLLWRSDRVGFDTKAAGLLAAMLLSAPYLWFYEGALLAAVALFLLRGGVLSPRPLHFLLLVPLWIGGGLQAINVFLKALDQRWLGATFIAPLLVICLALCLRQMSFGRPTAEPSRQGTPPPPASPTVR